MYENPDSLQEVCLDYISDNIGALCEITPSIDIGETNRLFRCDDFCFPATLSDQLMASLVDKQKLDDDTISLFDSRCTNLRRVKIKSASLTAKGLRMLKSHRIIELEASGLEQMTVNDVIGCLGEWTLANLRLLNVKSTAFTNSAKFCVVVSLSKLCNLQYLNVSDTDFNNHGLEIITEDLPSLEALDISNTPIDDLSPLLKLRSRLKSLWMYSLQASHNERAVPILCELKRLQLLDVSDDCPIQPFVAIQHNRFQVDNLLVRVRSLPSLSALDISGRSDITEELLCEFVDKHPKLRFLGLALTPACDYRVFADPECETRKPDLKVTGESTERQLCESLARYVYRPVYVQRTLFNLFRITQQLTEPRTDIIKLILPAMKLHPRQLGVQMAATACLYNLSRAEMGGKVHPHWLAKVIHLTMDAMDNFPNHKQLQKNALLTLCSDRILQDVSFDRFRCARLVMECLCAFDDSSMDRMSVAICGILAAKIPTYQTTQLGAKEAYMKKLLTIIEEKRNEQLVDITLKFTLSALWNLTDEAPSTCQVFLKEGGLELFMDVLETFKDTEGDNKVSVETKVLGLINNLAEVPALRAELMKDDTIAMIRRLLYSKHIDVSYFAAGIVSHLVCDHLAPWTSLKISRPELLRQLGQVVLTWEQPQGEMVAYRSFTPFFPLLDQFDTSEVQLWAVWAMQHVCAKNGPRYCQMLVEEGGAAILHRLVHDGRTQADVNRLARDVLDIIDEELGKTWRSVL